jgi:hypothetical protein
MSKRAGRERDEFRSDEFLRDGLSDESLWWEYPDDDRNRLWPTRRIDVGYDATGTPVPLWWRIWRWWR